MYLSPVAPLLQDWQRRDERSHLLSGDNTAVCSFPHPPTPIGLWPDWQSVQAASHRLSPGDWAAQPSPCRRGSRPDVGLPPPQSPTARGRSRSIWFAGKCSAAPTATTCHAIPIIISRNMSDRSNSFRIQDSVQSIELSLVNIRQHEYENDRYVNRF